MRYVIEHETRLTFPSPVSEHQCEMRLTPRQDGTQHLLSVDLSVEPYASLYKYTDAFGNRVHHFSVLEPHDSLVTSVRIEVETALSNPFDYALLPADAEDAWYENLYAREPHMLQYLLHESPQVRRLQSLALQGIRPPERNRQRPIQYSLMNAMEWVSSYLTYRPGATDTHAPLETVVDRRAGVCQDFAHLMISLVRSWGLPARYVMGYVAPMANSAGAQASHAWAEVMIPNAGWRGFDPTHLLVVNDSYVAVASGRDSLDAAPQRGSFKGPLANGEPDIRVMMTQAQQ